MANDDITNEGLIDISGVKNIGMRVTQGELPAYDEQGGGEAQAASAVPLHRVMIQMKKYTFLTIVLKHQLPIIKKI